MLKILMTNEEATDKACLWQPIKDDMPGPTCLGKDCMNWRFSTGAEGLCLLLMTREKISELAAKECGL